MVPKPVKVDSIEIIRVASGGVQRDPEYNFVPPLRDAAKRGRQCGQCGMKFEYYQPYGYCCPDRRCPMGLN